MITWDYRPDTIGDAWYTTYQGRGYGIYVTGAPEATTFFAYLIEDGHAEDLRFYEGSRAEADVHIARWQATFLEILMEETL